MNNYKSEKYYLIKTEDGRRVAEGKRYDDYKTAYFVMCQYGLLQYWTAKENGSEPMTYHIEEHSIVEYDDECGGHHRNELVKRV